MDSVAKELLAGFHQNNLWRHCRRYNHRFAGGFLFFSPIQLYGKMFVMICIEIFFSLKNIFGMNKFKFTIHQLF